jgi:uncharacterized protein YkwD
MQFIREDRELENTASRKFRPVVCVLLFLAVSACGSSFGVGQSNPTQPATTMTSAPTYQKQQLAAYIFGLINHDRAVKGLSPYAWSNALAGGAHLHNLRMVAYGQLSHQTPGEPDLGTRITNDGIHWSAVGENVGQAFYSDPQQGLLAIHQGMMAERPPNDGHRQNILSTSYNLVGIDVLIDSKNQVWLTEDFAQA